MDHAGSSGQLTAFVEGGLRGNFARITLKPSARGATHRTVITGRVADIDPATLNVTIDNIMERLWLPISQTGATTDGELVEEPNALRAVSELVIRGSAIHAIDALVPASLLSQLSPAAAVSIPSH